MSLTQRDAQEKRSKLEVLAFNPARNPSLCLWIAESQRVVYPSPSRRVQGGDIGRSQVLGRREGLPHIRLLLRMVRSKDDHRRDSGPWV